MPHTRSRPKYRPNYTSPYPIYGQQSEDAQLVYQAADILGYYRERLVNIALSQFEWTGLPRTVDARYLEKTLLHNGSAVLMQPEGLDIWLGLGWIQRGGTFTSYGDPAAVYGVDFNGKQIPTSVWHLVRDNRSRSPIMPKIELYARRLARLDLTFDVNLMHQNKPYIVKTTKRELLGVKNIFQRIFAFDNVIEVNESMDEDSISTIDTRVDFKGNDLLEARRTLWADAVSMLGIASETAKKERLIADEITMNRQEDSVTLNSRLMERIELCNTLNDLHGLNVGVNLSQTPIDVSTLAESSPATPASDTDHTITYENEG